MNHTKCTNEILKTILYFDVFKYPITFHEICVYIKCPEKEIIQRLKNLMAQNLVFKFDEFYSTTNNSDLVEKRKKTNVNAKKIMYKASRMAKLIYQFPFIEAVFLSGSISKGSFKYDDDIDYFIITTPNKLWIAKMLLIAYKRIVLLNSHKYFCVNYFMSSNKLEIIDKNRFTATELTTLIPMYGNPIHYKNLKEKNTWVFNFFTENSLHKKELTPLPKGFIKMFLEFLLKGKLGSWLEMFFMKTIQNRQKRKFAKLHNTQNFKIAFRGNKDTSKHHPDNHQTKTIKLLNKKIIEFNKKHQFSIPLEK